MPAAAVERARNYKALEQKLSEEGEVENEEEEDDGLVDAFDLSFEQLQAELLAYAPKSFGPLPGPEATATSTTNAQQDREQGTDSETPYWWQKRSTGAD